MAFAYGTLINTPNGNEPIEQLVTGGKVVEWYNGISSPARLTLVRVQAVPITAK